MRQQLTWSIAKFTCKLPVIHTFMLLQRCIGYLKIFFKLPQTRIIMICLLFKMFYFGCVSREIFSSFLGFPVSILRSFLELPRHIAPNLRQDINLIPFSPRLYIKIYVDGTIITIQCNSPASMSVDLKKEYTRWHGEIKDVKHKKRKRKRKIDAKILMLSL